MRETLTAIAVLLIVALLAAIAGPYFVDWNGQRARIEQELTARLGLPVRIDGDVSVRLLPTPTLRAKAVHLAGTESPASLSMDEIALFLAPQALLQGRFQITEMSLQSPQLALDRTALAAGTADAGIDLAALRRIGIERLSITNGSVRERRAADPVVAGIDGVLSAPSLAGPIRGSGSFALGGYRPTYRFSTGEATADKVSLDVLIEDPSAGMKLESQGEYRFRETADGAAGTFAGTVVLGGSTAMSLDPSAPGVAWRAQSKALFGASDARLSELVLTLGQRPAEITLRGEASFIFAEGLMSVALASRQIDADQLFGSGNPKRIAPADLITRLQTALGALLAGGAGNAAEAGLAAPELALGLTAEAITMGGDQIRDARLRMRAGLNGVRIETFAAGLPFDGRVSFLGDAASESGAGGGRLAISVPSLPRFTGWALQTPANGGGLESLELAGNMRWDEARVAVADAALVTNGVSWTGTLGWTPPDPATNPTGLIEVQMRAPLVDLDRLPIESLGAGSGPSNLPAFDLALAVDKLAFGGGSFGGVKLDAERSGDRLTIKEMTVEDFGGASLTAKGEMTPGSDAIEARMRASDLTALAGLAQRAAPGPLADWLTKTKAALAPAEVSISLTTSTAADGIGRNRSLIIDGSFQGSRAKVSGLWRENVGPGGSASEPSSLGLSVEGPDAGLLLNQLGFNHSVRELGPASLLANLRGSIATGFEVEAAADAAFGKGSLSGKITLTNPSYPLVGTLTLNAFDLGAISRATGIDPDFLPAGRSGFVTGEVWGSPAKLLITKMTAELADSTFRGEVAFKLDQGGKVAGQLRVDRLNLTPVLGIPFGNWPKTQPGEYWARAPFSASDPPVLDGDLWIEAEELTLSPGIALGGARFVLRFAKNLLNFEQADARFLGGRVTGEVMMRRSEEAVQISSKLDLTDIDLSRLGQAGLDARVSGKIENSAIGLSPASLIASLAGGGAVAIRNVVVSALDPGALTRVAKEGLDMFSAEGGQALAKLFEEELARAPLRAPEVTAQFSMAGGTMRLGPVSFPVDGVTIEASGSADLKTMAVNGRVQMTSSETVKGIRTAPQAGISWTGLLGALSRRTDFGAFTAAVTERAIEIEQERTAAFEDDLRERAMFNRRLKADRAQIAAEQEARIAAERDAAITEQAERIRLHFERIQLEAAARRERADSLQEEQREGRRAAAFTASTKPQSRPRSARPALVEDAQAPAAPDVGAPIDLTPPQPTQ